MKLNFLAWMLLIFFLEGRAFQAPAEAKEDADFATDEQKQFETDKAAAENGSRYAQNSVAFDYRQGKGVPKNEVEAAKWFRKSAEQGYVYAQSSLGLCYEDGEGVLKD